MVFFFCIMTIDDAYSVSLPAPIFFNDDDGDDVM
jgi:hypothetical protein